MKKFVALYPENKNLKPLSRRQIAFIIFAVLACVATIIAWRSMSGFVHESEYEEDAWELYGRASTFGIIISSIAVVLTIISYMLSWKIKLERSLTKIIYRACATIIFIIVILVNGYVLLSAISENVTDRQNSAIIVRQESRRQRVA